jgi:mannosyltransferase OCH1-like enzyme
MRVFVVALASLATSPSIAHGVDKCIDAKERRDAEDNDDDTVSFLQQFSVKVKQEDMTSDPKEQGADLKKTQIPLQLVMTGSFPTLDDLPNTVKENLQNTRNRAPGFTIRYLDDAACREYLTTHFREEFFEIYDREQHGSFRGDICRSAVLLREGGFYADLDFQFHDGLRIS